MTLMTFEFLLFVLECLLHRGEGGILQFALNFQYVTNICQKSQEKIGATMAKRRLSQKS